MDKSQMRAVSFRDGPCLVLAGPGSGKTTVITHRIQALLSQKAAAPEEILVITFTRAAALEMRNRFLSLVPSEEKKTAGRVLFGTFHAFFYRILLRHTDYSTFRILTARQKEILLKEAVFFCQIKNREDPLFLRSLLSSFSHLAIVGRKNLSETMLCGLSPEEFFALEAEYQKRKRTYGYFDFDDLGKNALGLLQTDPKQLSYWQNRLHYLMVDEAQDMDSLQYKILRLLSAGRQNLFLVGDDDQSIYGFRGASAEMFPSFLRDYPEAETLFLNQNYRSAKEIVLSAQQLISHNTMRMQKEIYAAKVLIGKMSLSRFHSFREQAKAVQSRARALSARGRSVGILYRHHIDAAELSGLFSGTNADADEKAYVSSGIAQDLRAYFSLAAGAQRRSDLLRILNRPERFLPRMGLEEEIFDFTKWIVFYEQDPQMQKKIRDLQEQLTMIGQLPPYAAYLYLLRNVGYGEYLKSQPNRLEELRLLPEFAEIAKRTKTARAFVEELDRLAQAENRKKQERSKKKKNRISLMTYHEAKGLEFDDVILISLNEGIVPARQADSPEALEEERRMFYVAMTRARESVWFCFLLSDQKKRLAPSRFLAEAGALKKKQNP